MKRLPKLKRTVLALVIASLFSLGDAFFSGNIKADKSEISATDVTYTFTLAFTQQIPQDGKLVVRFPVNYTTPFTEPVTCKSISGFSVDSGTDLECDYLSSVRLLTITQGFPTTFTEMQFSVTGVTNPKFANETTYFKTESFYQSGGDYIPLESSSEFITFTPMPGVLSDETMSLSSSIVGVYSTLSIEMTNQNLIPKEGYIQILFPKWNPSAKSSATQTQSYVATSTSPGAVPCKETLVTSGLVLDCIYTHFNTYDILQINYAGNIGRDIEPGTKIRIEIENTRAPPTTSVISGFEFSTFSQNGMLIDKTDGTLKKLTLKADLPATDSASSMVITSSDPSINIISDLRFQIRTLNPLKPNSSVTITIPEDFNLPDGTINSLQTLGSQLNPNPEWSFEVETRTLVVNKINLENLASLNFITIVIGRVQNPAKTEPTGTFTYLIRDPLGFPVEQVLEGVTFTASAGGFAITKLTASDYTINVPDVEYTFEIQPQDNFDSNAIMKLVLPKQISISESAQILSTSGQMSASSASINILFNRIIYISGAFPEGYTSGKPYSFTIKGFKNPQNSQTTDSFELKIFYEEYVNEVAQYLGQNLSFKGEPSRDIEFATYFTDTQSGELQSNLTVVAQLGSNMTIEKQSYLRMSIPPEYRIQNFKRVASTCLRLWGFSDEIQCQIESTKKGYDLLVRGGFDSETFDSSTFGFQIAEIRNPFTTQETQSFDLKVFDKYDGLQYEYVGQAKQRFEASPFAFAFIQSKDGVNGVESFYSLSLTIGVDTPISAQIQITLPDELQVVQEDKFTCKGIEELTKTLPCTHENGVITFSLSHRESNGFLLKNGTTVVVEFGPIKNYKSLAPTSSFQVRSGNFDQESYYLYNEVVSGLEVKNSKTGQITITDVIQSDKQLGAQTSLQLNIKTQNLIDEGMKMDLTLPSNLRIDPGFQNPVTVNGNPVSASINTVGFLYSFKLPVGGNEFQVKINGLKNPEIGPYSFKQFQLRIADAQNFAIDKLNVNDSILTVDCLENCATCRGNLAVCNACSYDANQNITFYLYENKCNQDCPKGYFQGSDYTCEKCDLPCTECREHAKGCTLCSNTQTDEPLWADPISLQCYKECPDGTYLDQEKRQCLRCEEPCYKCKSKTECLSCDRTQEQNSLIYFFDKHYKCYDECPSVSIPTPSKNCVACEAPCITCAELPDMCTSCQNGTYLFKSSCVSECPFLYFQQEDTNSCLFVGEMALPVPFSIVAFILSIGIGISAFLKGSDKDGREKPGTAFFITMLAIVDIMLRINWIILAILFRKEGNNVTFACLAILLVACLLLNFFIWRRFFYSKYRYEDQDPLFSDYVKRYPGLSTIIIFTSYVFTFQAIRLSYSRFLGRKKFMANFTRKKRYFKLIGRLSVLETIFIYIPAIGINIVSIHVFTLTESNRQTFYLNIDSLILVTYAALLMVVVLSQKEKLHSSSHYFKFTELFTFDGDADQDDDEEEDDCEGEEEGFEKQLRFGNDGNESQDQIDVASALGHEDLLKMRMYQEEKRYWSQTFETIAQVKNQHIAKGYRTTQERPVSVMEYNEYRKLEDKKDKIMLKKILYERKKENDESQIAMLNGELKSHNQEKESLQQRVLQLQYQLENVQSSIASLERQAKKEVKQVEQMKRQDIMRRAGKEVPTIISYSRSPIKKRAPFKPVNHPPFLGGSAPKRNLSQEGNVRNQHQIFDKKRTSTQESGVENRKSSNGSASRRKYARVQPEPQGTGAVGAVSPMRATNHRAVDLANPVVAQADTVTNTQELQRQIANQDSHLLNENQTREVNDIKIELQTTQPNEDFRVIEKFEILDNDPSSMPNLNAPSHQSNSGQKHDISETQ